MKKWIISACVAAVGLLLLGISAKLCGDLGAYHLSQPGSHGQFTGSDRGLLLWFFAILLAGVAILGTIASLVAVGLKWKRITFQKTTYPNLFYWTLCIPIVAYILCFSSWATWNTIRDCMKYLW